MSTELEALSVATAPPSVVATGRFTILPVTCTAERIASAVIAVTTATENVFLSGRRRGGYGLPGTQGTQGSVPTTENVR